jgi:uncharacterized phage protein (TIGR01671 family)
VVGGRSYRSKRNQLKIAYNRLKTKQNMNREILFRGKTLGSKQWMFGNLFVSGNQCFIMSQKNDTILKHFGTAGHWYINKECAQVSPETVSQFTGFVDKNGTKIFEGDIIKCHQADKNLVFWFEDGSWCIENYHASALPLYDYSQESEVIGNIHDK